MHLPVWNRNQRTVRPGYLVVAFLIVVIDLVFIYAIFPMVNNKHCFSVASLPATHAPLLILGAGVLPNQKPSQLLKARLDAGLKLFNDGKGDWFIVSGDNRTSNYNEPKVMRNWLLSRGVPKNLIVSDFAGKRTYDSLKRAQNVFGVSKVVIVTSDFHLARAMFLARNMGLDAYGVTASTKIMPLSKFVAFWAREYIARHIAIWDLWFPPTVAFGSRESTPENLKSSGEKMSDALAYKDYPKPSITKLIKR
jgi:vancomycin permeability regulator SanA